MFLCISGVPINALAPMKNCLEGCKVGQISFCCTKHRLALCMQILSWRGLYFQCYAPCERFFCAKIAFIKTVGKNHSFKNSEKLEIKFYLTSIV